LSNKGTYLPTFPLLRPGSPRSCGRSRRAIDAISSENWLISGHEKLAQPLESRQRSLTPQQREHLENTGTGRSPCDRDARRVDKRCRFNVLLFRCSSHRRFHMWLVEGHHCTECVRERLHMFVKAWGT